MISKRIAQCKRKKQKPELFKFGPSKFVRALAPYGRSMLAVRTEARRRRTCGDTRREAAICVLCEAVGARRTFEAFRTRVELRLPEANGLSSR
jgi:hypothetical protein